MQRRRREPGTFGRPLPPAELPASQPPITDVVAESVSLAADADALTEYLAGQARDAVEAHRAIDAQAEDELRQTAQHEIAKAAALDERLQGEIAESMRGRLIEPVDLCRQLGDQIHCPWDTGEAPPAVAEIAAANPTATPTRPQGTAFPVLTPPPTAYAGPVLEHPEIKRPAGLEHCNPTFGERGDVSGWLCPIGGAPQMPPSGGQLPAYEPGILPPGTPTPALEPPGPPGAGVKPPRKGRPPKAPPGYICTPIHPNLPRFRFPNVLPPQVVPLPQLPNSGSPPPSPPLPGQQPSAPGPGEAPRHPSPAPGGACCGPRFTLNSDDSWSADFPIEYVPQLAALIPEMMTIAARTYDDSETKVVQDIDEDGRDLPTPDSW